MELGDCPSHQKLLTSIPCPRQNLKKEGHLRNKKLHRITNTACFYIYTCQGTSGLLKVLAWPHQSCKHHSGQYKFLIQILEPRNHRLLAAGLTTENKRNYFRIVSGHWNKKLYTSLNQLKSFFQILKNINCYQLDQQNSFCFKF